MRVRSSSVASVSRALSSVTGSPLVSVAACQPRKRGAGLGDEPLDHFARGHDFVDEPRALAAGGVPTFDVALLARPDRGGKSHTLSLEGEGQDLRGALLPFAREVVPDGAAGLSGGAPVYHGPLLVDRDDPLLVVVVPMGLVGGD